MGRGGDGSVAIATGVRSGSGRLVRRSKSVLDKLDELAPRFEARQKVRQLHNEITVLKNIWFKKLADTDDHAARLEQFYKDQAHACKLLFSLIYLQCIYEYTQFPAIPSQTLFQSTS